MPRKFPCHRASSTSKSKALKPKLSANKNRIQIWTLRLKYKKLSLKTARFITRQRNWEKSQKTRRKRMPRSSCRRMPWKMTSIECKMIPKSSKMSTKSFYLWVTRWRQSSAIKLLLTTRMAPLTSAYRARRETIEWMHAVNCPETCSWTTCQRIYADWQMENKETITKSSIWMLLRVVEGKIFSIP